MISSNDSKIVTFLNNYSIKLFCYICKKNNNGARIDMDYRTPHILSTSCIYTGIRALYVGSNENTRHILDSIPYFKNIFEFASKPNQYKSVLTIPYNIETHNITSSWNLVDDNDNILNDLYSIDENLYIFNTPRNPVDVFILNETIRRRRTRRNNVWHGININFYSPLTEYDKFYPIQLKYVTLLAGPTTWKYKFEKNKTKKRPFHLLQETIMVETMARERYNTTLLSFYYESLKCLFVSIPYENEYSMLIIKPDNYFMGREKFIEFYESNLSDGRMITDFYFKYGQYVKYDKIYLPKFHITSECHLNKEEEEEEEIITTDLNNVDYLMKELFNKSINLSLLSKNLNNEKVKLVCHTEFICNEIGTIFTSPEEEEEEDENDDDDDDDDNSNNLRIDNNFIFAILNPYKNIEGLGIFELGQKIHLGISTSPFDIYTIY